MKINRKIMYFFQNQICNFAMLVLYISAIGTAKLSTIRVEPAAYNRLKYKGATSAYFSE